MPTRPRTPELEKPKPAKPKPAKPKEFKGVCIHCGSDALRMNGTRGGKQIYFCKTCGRIMGGFPIPAQNLCGRKSTVQSLHCPKCRGAARIRERVDEYRSRLVCNVCGYYFTDCYRHAPPDRDSGPFLYPITFHLDAGALRGLMEICRVTGFGESRAIRLVLREEAWAQPIYAIAVRGRVLPRLRPTLDMPAPHVLAARLPDLNPTRIREMAANRVPGKRGSPALVGVVGRVNVAMDAVAKAGLLKGMAKYKCDHQQAVRHLLADRPHAR